MMGFGFVVARFGLFLRELHLSKDLPAHRSGHFSVWFGTSLVLMGVIVTLLGTREYRGAIRRLRQGTWTPDHLSRSGVTIAVVLAAAGIAVVIYLLQVG
jgi:putative membrane protein